MNFDSSRYIYNGKFYYWNNYVLYYIDLATGSAGSYQFVFPYGSVASRPDIYRNIYSHNGNIVRLMVSDLGLLEIDLSSYE